MIWETSFLILQKFDDTTACTVKIVKFYLNTVRAKYIKNRVFLSFSCFIPFSVLFYFIKRWNMLSIYLGSLH